MIGLANMKNCSKQQGKKAFTVTLSEETYAALVALAKKESRPIAQMARVIIEKAVDKDTIRRQSDRGKK